MKHEWIHLGTFPIMSDGDCLTVVGEDFKCSECGMEYSTFRAYRPGSNGQQVEWAVWPDEAERKGEIEFLTCESYVRAESLRYEQEKNWLALKSVCKARRQARISHQPGAHAPGFH